MEDVCNAMVKEGGVDRVVTFAKVAEVAERYEDMVEAVKCMATALQDTPMTGRLVCNALPAASFVARVGSLTLCAWSGVCFAVEQRNLFSVAFKNVVGAKRASWRVLDSLASDKKTVSDQCATQENCIAPSDNCQQLDTQYAFVFPDRPEHRHRVPDQAGGRAS
mgnify:CR=1 FL=1